MNRKIRISVAVLTIVGVCFCSVLTWAADDTQAVEAPNAAASAEGSQLQPTLAYQLGDGWSLSLGDLQIAYDWKNGDFVSIPFGMQLGKVLPVWGQPMRFAVNPQFNFKDTPGVNKFSVLLTGFC